jgi:hypothetical protein
VMSFVITFLHAQHDMALLVVVLLQQSVST